MKLELQFNEPIYKKQMELLYEMGYGRKKAYLKNSNYLGFVFVSIGILIVIGKGNIGYLFILLGLINLISFYYFHFKQKKITLKYLSEQNEIISKFEENSNATFEFRDDGLFYSDYTGKININWNEFLIFIEKDENIFLITKSFQPFAIGKSEIGTEKYDSIVNFVATKMEKTSR